MSTSATTFDPKSEIGFSVGGVGGAHFLADPGGLTIDLYKRDRNIHDRQTDLRAILVSPDREVIQEENLPDAGTRHGGGPGPWGHVRLSAQVKRKGVYGLNITVSRDRYGEEILWGFRTNCPRWLIETARGHNNAHNEEPIVLAGLDRPADVCFLPSEGELTLEVVDLPKGVDELRMYDGEGTLLAEISVKDGRAGHTFPAGTPRDAAPWRLHLPLGQATVHVDGLTRWDEDDLSPGLALWTPEASSYFHFQPYRSLFRPCRRVVYGQAGEPGEVPFEVHNSSRTRRTLELSLEFPDAAWPVEPSDDRLELGPEQSREVRLRFTVPPEGQTRVCHLRATPAEDPEFSTYSTLEVVAGVAPAEKPIDVPIVLTAYRHENEQLGYLPDYSTQMYFDPENRPFVRTDTGIETLREGRWIATDFRSAVTPPDNVSAGQPWSRLKSCAKVAFDRQGGVYVLGESGGHIALLHSTDGGATFTACAIPPRAGGTGTQQFFDIEEFSGHNTSDGPPPILRCTRTASDPGVRFRHLHDWELFLPEKRGGRVIVGDPIPISKNGCVMPGHSGRLSSVVSRDGKVHVAWGEATDPEVEAPGVPTFVATCDRATRKLDAPAPVGHGPPANDTHNAPAITMDSRGHLHVLVGTHGRPFPYVRSLKPNDAGAGWTEPELTGEGLSQTYIALVCGPDDTLHATFRLWRHRVEPFSASHYGTLAYQRKRPGEPWEPPRVLVVAPFADYSWYGNYLTLDRAGRLFLSYSTFTTYRFYRNDHRDGDRAVLMSPDGGETWKLAGAGDLTSGP